MRRIFSATAGLCLLGSSLAHAQKQPSAAPEVIAIKAGKILTARGPAISNGVIVIRGGVIDAVGVELAIPGGAKVIDAADAVVTPGLIDACCLMDPEIPANFYSGAFSGTSGAAANGGGPRNSALAGNRLSAGGRLASNGSNAIAARFAQPIDSAPASPGVWTNLAANAGHVHEHGAAFGRQALDPSDVDPEADGGCSPACAGAASDHDHAEGLASALANSRITWAEHSAEVTPHCRVLDTVNLFSTDFARLLRSGVTSVYVSPDPASVIGSRGAVVRTGGPLAQRVIEPDSAIKAAMGQDPCRRGRGNMIPRGNAAVAVDFHIRRPNTRMGVEFAFRKAFYDAMSDGEGRPLHGADSPPAAALPILREVLQGKRLLRIQARKSHDIITALRLAQEFKLHVTLDEATEAYQVLPELKASGMSVVLGPIFATATGFRTFVLEGDEPRLDTARRLQEAGIPFAITAQEMRDEEGLARQAMFAVANGLPSDDALQAVTTSAAKILGVHERVGAIETGMAADLVIWSGMPFESTSRVRTVIVGGEVVAN